MVVTVIIAHSGLENDEMGGDEVQKHQHVWRLWTSVPHETSRFPAQAFKKSTPCLSAPITPRQSTFAPTFPPRTPWPALFLTTMSRNSFNGTKWHLIDTLEAHQTVIFTSHVPHAPRIRQFRPNLYGSSRGVLQVKHLSSSGQRLDWSILGPS